MAVVLGNVALLLDVNSVRTITTDRKPRQLSLDVLLNLPKRDLTVNNSASVNKSSESEAETRNHRVVARGKANSKFNGVDFDAASSDEENGNGDEENWEEKEDYDWEKEMRKRVKELEEMKELERKAEELQSKVNDDSEGEEPEEETEEEKKMRVRRELEKVSFFNCSCSFLS